MGSELNFGKFLLVKTAVLQGIAFTMRPGHKGNTLCSRWQTYSIVPTSPYSVHPCEFKQVYHTGKSMNNVPFVARTFAYKESLPDNSIF